MDTFEQLLLNDSANVLHNTALTISYIFSILGGALSVLITCGNVLVIISIVYFKQLHTPTNYLMLSLAVADLLVGLFVVPFSILLSLMSNVLIQNVLCKLRGIIDMIVSISSIWNLCFISVDRYYAVCQPLRYRSKITGRIAGIMILVTWSVATLTAIIFLFHSPDKAQPNVRCILIQNKSKRTMIVGAFVSFCIPAIMMSSIYLKILIVAKRQARSIVNTSKSGANVSKMERKATKTLAIVMGVFLMSWTPFFLCVSLHPVVNYRIPAHVIQLFKGLGWTNSMCNPFIYGFFYKHFQTAFKMIISRKIFQEYAPHTKLF